jgi:hypothetical protein
MHLRDEWMAAGSGRAWKDNSPLESMPEVVAVDTKINIWVEIRSDG